MAACGREVVGRAVSPQGGLRQGRKIRPFPADNVSLHDKPPLRRASMPTVGRHFEQHDPLLQALRLYGVQVTTN